ncbi:MAG: hypothetical protein MK041_02570 [Aquabacterium sp.]|nr:hypothetical protein [Aquabacterium sp.]
MAQPNPHNAGSERGQRQHAGSDSRYTDAGVKAGGQGTPGTGQSSRPPKDDIHSAPESGEKNAAQDPDRAKSAHRPARGFDQG